MQRAREPIHTAACFSKGAIQFEAPSQANGNKLILKDARIIEVGDAKGHGVSQEKQFCEKLIQLAEGRRIKCRMGHPDMCSDSFGKLVGHYENHRLVETEDECYVVADLHLSTAAMKSPHGNITEYVQEIAKEYPDMFGNSIVFYEDYYYYRTNTGVEVRCDYHQHSNDEGLSVHNEDGSVEPYNSEKHGGLMTTTTYLMPAAYEATDLVDEPAATSEFFSEKTLLGRIISALGFETRNLRKIAELKQQLSKINMKFSINATTTDGTALVIDTDNDSIRVGDNVTVAGEPAPDGAHDIESSDSQESGITITTEAGVITSIAKTVVTDPQPTDTPMANPEPANELSSMKTDVKTLSSQIEAMNAKMAEMEEKLAKVQTDLANYAAMPLDGVKPKKPFSTLTTPMEYPWLNPNT